MFVNSQKLSTHVIKMIRNILNLTCMTIAKIWLFYGWQVHCAISDFSLIRSAFTTRGCVFLFSGDIVRPELPVHCCHLLIVMKIEAMNSINEFRYGLYGIDIAHAGPFINGCQSVFYRCACSFCLAIKRTKDVF